MSLSLSGQICDSLLHRLMSVLLVNEVAKSAVLLLTGVGPKKVALADCWQKIFAGPTVQCVRSSTSFTPPPKHLQAELTAKPPCLLTAAV